MEIFDSDWERLHKKICHQYELIALRDLESGLSPDVADVFGIITEIVRNYIPNLSYDDVSGGLKML
jgi:hypothetical protein